MFTEKPKGKVKAKTNNDINITVDQNKVNKHKTKRAKGQTYAGAYLKY